MEKSGSDLTSNRIDIPHSEVLGTEEDSEFWTKMLKPGDSRLPEIHQAVTSYLPGVVLEGLQPDYVGIRPKLIPCWGSFQISSYGQTTQVPTRRTITRFDG